MKISATVFNFELRVQFCYSTRYKQEVEICQLLAEDLLKCRSVMFTLMQTRHVLDIKDYINICIFISMIVAKCQVSSATLLAFSPQSQ